MVGVNKLGFKLDSASVAAEGAAIFGALNLSGVITSEGLLISEGVFRLTNEGEVSLSNDAVKGLNEEQIKSCIELERELEEKDKKLKLLEEAKNTLEAFIYELKDKSLSNEKLLPSNIVKPLLDVEEAWLYSDEGFNCTDPTVFHTRLSTITSNIRTSCPEYYKSVEEAKALLEAQLEEESKKAEAEKANDVEEDHDFRKMKFPDRMRIMLKKYVMNNISISIYILQYLLQLSN